MISWDDRYATGVKTIDDQHKMLILHINQLGELLKNSTPTHKEIVFANSLVEFLEGYSITHFKFEEQCMESYRCPAHSQNKQQHAQFLEFFGHFKQKFHAEGFSVEAFKELHQTTSSWIGSHILRTDSQLAPCVKTK